MKIAVIGQTGQLARALGALDTEVTLFGRDQCDLTNEDAALKSFIIGLSGFEAVINAAAYTAVDQAESDYETALQVNGHAPGILAQVCAQVGLRFVHISTDYVFRGDHDRPYQATDPVDPINAYGRSKLAGEKAVIKMNPKAAILRTSWVFDGLGKNFLTTMMRLAQTRDTLGVVGDAYGRPTFADDLAMAALAAAKNPKHNGIYHVSGAGEVTSWAGFAREIFDQSRQNYDPPLIPQDMSVNAIKTEDYPTPAARPLYSVMDITDFEHDFDVELPNWKNGVRRALEQYQRNEEASHA